MQQVSNTTLLFLCELYCGFSEHNYKPPKMLINKYSTAQIYTNQNMYALNACIQNAYTRLKMRAHASVCLISMYELTYCFAFVDMSLLFSMGSAKEKEFLVLNCWVEFKLELKYACRDYKM